MNTIKELICAVLEIDLQEISETSLFKEDHGADSLRAVEILAAIEKKFEVVIHESELPRMVNLRGVHDVVAEAVGE